MFRIRLGTVLRCVDPQRSCNFGEKNILLEYLHLESKGRMRVCFANATNKFLKDRVAMVMRAMRVIQEPYSSLDEEQMWTPVRVACERKS